MDVKQSQLHSVLHADHLKHIHGGNNCPCAYQESIEADYRPCFTSFPTKPRIPDFIKYFDREISA